MARQWLELTRVKGYVKSVLNSPTREALSTCFTSVRPPLFMCQGMTIQMFLTLKDRTTVYAGIGAR